MSCTKNKIVIAAVPYSDNLGDGIIAGNLSALINGFPCFHAEVLDIAFRKGYASRVAKTNSVFAVYLRLPQLLRSMIVIFFFLMKFASGGKAQFRQALDGAKLILIGGGQLFSDVDANFPIKLLLLTRMAERRNIPIKIIAVGVGSKWTWIGRAMMLRVLKSRSVVAISVRDEISVNNLRTHFGIERVSVLRDPALLSSLTYGNPIKVDKAAPILALGVASLDTLNHSGDLKTGKGNSPVELASLVMLANENGYTVSIFTNGGVEDRDYLENVVLPYLKTQKLVYSVEPAFQEASGLVRFLATSDFVVAFRLHANIVARAFNIPSLAICWDRKIEAFFESEGRGEDVFTSLSALSAALPARLQAARTLASVDVAALSAQYHEFIGLQ